jgi:hypothetical protein
VPSFQYPPQYPPDNYNNRYGTDGLNNNGNGYGVNGINNNNGFGVNGFNNNGNGYQNPYDIEYERKLRVETEKLRQLLIEIDKKNSAECTLNVAAQWNFETNVNEVTQLEAVSITSFRAPSPSESLYDIDPKLASHSTRHSYPIIEIFLMLTRNILLCGGKRNCFRRDSLGKLKPQALA